MNISFNEDCTEVMKRYPDQYFEYVSQIRMEEY